MDRATYYAAHRAHRECARRCRYYSLSEAQRREEYRRLPALPQPPRTPLGQLLLDQAARRANKLYWIGYRKRMASQSFERMPPRTSIPEIPGWDRTAIPA